MTLDYYNKNSVKYSQETLSVEFSKRQNMLLKYLKSGAHILDLGCGAGRDSKAFIEKGYQVTSVDGSKKLSEIARGYIGQDVICKKFQDLDEKSAYDAIWACASLLHVPWDDLGSIIKNLSKALKSGGYLYGSFKYGDFEGKRKGRYFTDLTKERLNTLLEPFEELELIETDITKDVRPSRKDEKWLNFIVKKR